MNKKSPKPLTPYEARKMLLRLAKFYKNEGSEYNVYVINSGSITPQEMVLYLAYLLPICATKKRGKR